MTTNFELIIKLAEWQKQRRNANTTPINLSHAPVNLKPELKLTSFESSTQY